MSNLARIIVGFAILMGAIVYTALGQCGYDSIGGGGNGVGIADTATCTTDILPRCTGCATEGCTAWELPTDFNGHFFLNSSSQTLVSIQITTNCTQVLYDTCAALPPNGMAGLAYVLQFAVIGNAQLIVCGDIGQEIYIYNKSITTPQEELFEVIFDLSNCDTLTSIMPIRNDYHPRYFDPFTLMEISKPLANRFYLKR